MRDLFKIGQSVAILGGSFDPITNGHLRVAEFVLEHCDWIDHICLMPTGSSNVGKVLTAAEHRLAMCQIAICQNSRISVSSYEISKGLSGSTMELFHNMKIDRLTEMYDLSFIIGLDNALTFDRWSNAEKLKVSTKFIVCPRTGYQLPDTDMWFTNAPHTYINEDYDLPEISSTSVRESLREGNLKDLNGKIPLWVNEYILENNLYINVKE